MRAGAIAAVGCALLGCAPGQSVVVVTVDASGTVSGAARLAFAFDNAGQSATATLALPGAPITIPPARRASFVFDKDRSGALGITVDALDGAGHRLATGAATTTLQPSTQADVTVTLGGVAVTDAGVDGAPDLAAPDLAAPPDLTMLDLVPPPDLVQCGASGQPCCGLTCSGQNACSAGTCVACGGPGQPCCSNQSCGANLVCNGATCVPCGNLNQPCCPNSFCSLSGPPFIRCSAGSCLPAGDVGQRCHPLLGCPAVNGGGCCDNDTCVANGSACTGLGGTCQNGSCGNGTCGATNQPCCNGTCTVGYSQCANGMTCSSCGSNNSVCCAQHGPPTCQGGLTCVKNVCGGSCGGDGQTCCVGVGMGSLCNMGFLCGINGVCAAP